MILEEVLDKELPERYPSISYGAIMCSDWYSTEDSKEHTEHAFGQFWEQRLTFLLILQEALT